MCGILRVLSGPYGSHNSVETTMSAIPSFDVRREESRLVISRRMLHDGALST
jgi:hypothetical protein